MRHREQFWLWRKRSAAHLRGLARYRANVHDGFTLIELLVVVAILPLVVGAIAVALLTVFSNSTATSSSISSSADTQVVSSEFVSDVQSAATITTMPTPASPGVCAAPGQTAFTHLISFTSADGSFETSYVSVPQGTNNVVFRNVCHSGTTVASISSVVAHTAQTVTAVVAGVPCPVTLGQGPTCPVSTSWTSTAGTAYAKLTITTPIPNTASSYSYSLQASPRVYSPSSSGIQGGGTIPVLLLGNGSSFNDWSCGGSLTVVTGQVTLDSTSGGASGGTITAPGGVYTADTSNPNGAVSGTTLQPPGAPVVSGPPVPDPYANLTAPTVPALSPTNSGAVGGVLQPGLYTNQLSAGGNTLASGIYYLEAGMDIGPGTTTGNGVFIYVASGAISVHGNANVNLTPLASPPSPTKDMTIWQAKSDTDQLSFDGTGNQGTTVDGIIYAPGAAVEIKGGGSSTGLTTDELLANQAICTGSHAPFTVTGQLP